MRIPTSVLAATAAVLVGLSSVVAAVPASAAPPKCSDLKGGLVGQNCVIEEGDAGYSLRISYPANYPDVQAVFDWVKQTRDGFVNVAKSPDARTMPYQLEVTPTEYNSAVPPRGTQSLVFKVFQDVGGAHPQTFYKAFSWDQAYRKPITFENLFRAGTDPLPVIFPVVQADLAMQSGIRILPLAVQSKGRLEIDTLSEGTVGLHHGEVRDPQVAEVPSILGASRTGSQD